jgi:hypothetical protein
MLNIVVFKEIQKWITLRAARFLRIIQIQSRIISNLL